MCRGPPTTASAMSSAGASSGEKLALQERTALIVPNRILRFTVRLHTWRVPTLAPQQRHSLQLTLPLLLAEVPAGIALALTPQVYMWQTKHRQYRQTHTCSLTVVVKVLQAERAVSVKRPLS